MDQTPEAFAAALTSGDTERVNRAIDEIEDMKLEERAAVFDDCFEMCRDRYKTTDGYQRQSVIRFAVNLYPRLELRTVGTDFTDDALPDEHTVDETASHRDRHRELYLDALVDDDGRVRRAAAKAIKELALTAELIGTDAELQTMTEQLESLGLARSGPEETHIE
ncbi:hypothetical protein [Halobacterium salinarum]|uniref:hypothetical protein n=1 Tax=Halobacterium salinarum TaxID=2242 RepID=UPI002555A5F3|nr:hypothetical protein [Halobacterium salinarum]MDL0126644.1 hypothetical protein [Halobacterium salinarum]